MVPMWSRTRRFANVYAFATIDMLFALFWFAAFCAVASWLASGKGKGDNKKKSGCANFKYGPEAKCTLAEVDVGFGVLLL